MPLLSEVPEIEIVEEIPVEEVFEEPIMVYESKPSLETVIHMHEPDVVEDVIEMDSSPESLEIDEIPGVDSLDPELEKELEIEEKDSHSDVSKVDDSKKSRKSKWDIDSKGFKDFIPWVKEKINHIPKHSGYDPAGIERAIAFLEEYNSEISRVMRTDLDGELDFNEVEKIRAELEDGIDRLYDRLEKVNNAKKNKLKKKKANFNQSLVKEAQKSTPINGIVITVPLLISRIARVCINGTISAGHDIEDLFERQVKLYKLNEREKAECVQLMSDMGYPIRQDRGFLIGEEVDKTSPDNFDWMASYQG